MENEIPIFIIDKEENFAQNENGLDYSKLVEVFKAEVYVFDWQEDQGKIVNTGERVQSEGSCSNFEFEPIIERAKDALEK